MAHFDLSGPDLEAYRPDVAVPADFDEFWRTTLAQARGHDLAATFVPVDNGLSLIDSYDVTFAGFGGDPVKGWLQLPAHGDGPLTTVVEYVGYGGGRGLVHESLLWAAAGFAHLVMDTRGQGSSWRVGDTPDASGGGAPAYPGYLTRGIADPLTYYYRRVFTDGVRAVEAARTHPRVDPARVAVTGGSQGGGISLAVGGLVPDLLAVLPDVPFLCDFRRATSLVDSMPYCEITHYLKVHRPEVDRVFTTLSYFDGVTFAGRATAPALFSVALMDETCPPSTVYAAYNNYAADKELRVYPFNDHEGGQAFQDAEKLRYLRER